MRRKQALIIGLVTLVLLMFFGCGGDNANDEPSLPLEVIGIDVNGQESDVYDPADPIATFPPENIISGTNETAVPSGAPDATTPKGATSTPKPTSAGAPTSTPKPTQNANPSPSDGGWDGGDATIVDGQGLL